MELSFWNAFLRETGFPTEAAQAIWAAWGQLDNAGQTEALEATVTAYGRTRNTQETQKALEVISEGSGVPVYTLWLLLLIGASEPVLERFRRAGEPEALFWQTFSDLRCKALECRQVYGVWGVFVAYWYPIFYTGEILKLGRLEYQDGTFQGEGPVTVEGFTVRPGDPVKRLHIPSSGEPFTREARLASYGEAYGRFCREKGGVLVCVCDSWLLYPPYEAVWPQGSHIREFAREFLLLEETPAPFSDSWRVFGTRTLSGALPEDTSLQRRFGSYLRQGGSTGTGKGLLIFDGSRILTQREG